MTKVDDKAPDKIRVGATLKALREAQGWPTDKFAETIGLDRSTLSNIEAGRRRLTPEKAQLAIKALNVPLAALISPSGDMVATEPNPRTRPVNTTGDTAVISLGDGGTITVNLDLRLLRMRPAHIQAVLNKIDELRQLGAEIEAAVEADEYQPAPARPLGSDT